jgi:hypothetical protein
LPAIWLNPLDRAGGTALAKRTVMRHRALLDLLAGLHRAIDQVADDLDADQPRLAQALRAKATSIPKPKHQVGIVHASDTRVACRCIPPLLYNALDHGLVDVDLFDALMVGQSRARRMLRVRNQP